MNTDELVIFEDDDFIAVNKPSGVLVIPDRFDKTKENLYDLLNQKYGKIWIIHRLDKDTSGVVIFAKNPEAHRDMSIKWDEKGVVKVYEALVIGEIETENGTINKPIGPLKKKKGVMVIDNDNGKESITHFKTNEKFMGYTLLDVMPKTGRTHQIRVHLAHIGYPIAGDVLYNRREAVGKSGVRSPSSAKAAACSPESGVKGKKKKTIPDSRFQVEIPRLMLHAAKLSFVHYKKGEAMELAAAMPEDMSKVILRLKLEGLVKG
jgi:23S rRNA pseudouridine1911/1915/1917 synthase